MASMVLGAVGSYFAGPIGYTIGSAIGSYLSTPDAPSVEGPRLSDTSVNISSWGSSLPILYGTHYVTGNIIWSSDIIEQSQTETQGGKGGAPSQEVTTYSYSMDFAVALCEGPAVAVPRIWANGKLIKNTSSTGTAVDYVASASARYSSAIYLGTSTQTADPVIQSYVGVANTPAYRNTCFIRFDAFQLGEFGNQPPQIAAEIVRTATTAVSKQLYAQSLNQSLWSTACTVIGFSGGGEFVLLTGDTSYSPTGVSANAWLMSPESTYFDSITVSDNECYGIPITQTEHPARITIDTSIVGLTEFTKVNYRAYGLATNGVGGDYHTGTTFASTLYNYASYNAWASSQACQAHGLLLFCIRKTVEADGWTLFFWDFLTHELIYSGDLSYATFGGDGLRFLIGADYIYAFTSNNEVLHISRTDGSIVDTIVSNNGFTQQQTYWLESDNEIWGLDMNASPATLWLYTPVTQTWALYKSSTQLRLSTATHFHVLFYVRNDILVACADVDTTPEQIIAGAFNLNAPTDTGEPIADIVEDICGRVGITAPNTAGISGNVSGLSLSRQVTARTAIEVLSGAYPFDAVVDSDLKFITRAGSTGTTVNNAELGAGVDSSDGVTVSIERQQDIEIPKQVVVNFSDRNSEYVVNSASAVRIGSNASGTRVMDMTAIAMTPDQAAQLADARLYEAWYGNISLSFSTSWEHFNLEPTDVIVLSGENRDYTCQIVSKTVNNGTLEFVAGPVESTIYTSAVIGGGGIPEQGISYVGQPIGLYLDLPLLQDKDDYPGIYVVVASGSASYTGAAIFQGSTQSTITNRLGSIANSATVGYSTTALGTSAGSRIIQPHRTVDVTLSTGTLSSTNAAGIRAGNNACILGGEVLQFMTATSLGGTSYRLSELVRGLKGTENYTDNHGAFESFVLLSGVAGIFTAEQDIGSSRYYQAIPFGRSASDMLPKYVTNNGLRTKLLAPLHTRLGNQGTARVLEWGRRTRYDLDKYTYASHPLDAPSTEYLVLIFSTSGRTTIVRSTTVFTESFIYTAAMATTDFGSMPGTLYWSVCQVHSTYGNGIFTDVTSTT